MAISNKKEIEIFYKTHNMGIKDVAAHFGMSYRTLAHWVKTEGWVAGSAVQNLQSMASPVLNENMNEVIDVAKVKIKREIKQNLGIVVSEVDTMILDNLLESSTDEILTRAMSLNFIQKNIALSAIIAKDRLLRLVRSSDDPKHDPIVIACAEKVAKIFGDMQGLIYGKNPMLQSSENVEDLSLEEINKLLSELGD